MTFHGNQQDGYSANEGSATCVVSKINKSGTRWRATISGSPTRNPLVKGEDGSVSRSCMCPTLVVGTQFKNRKTAALAGLVAYRKEWSYA